MFSREIHSTLKNLKRDPNNPDLWLSLQRLSDRCGRAEELNLVQYVTRIRKVAEDLEPSATREALRQFACQAVGLEMMEIPEGEFLVLRDPRHFYEDEICKLPRYWISKYPVTVEQYERFLSQQTPQQRKALKPSQWGLQRKNPQAPVTGVNAHDAFAFCLWVGGTLPTVGEWHKAAYGEDCQRYPWGPNLHRHRFIEAYEPWGVGDQEAYYGRKYTVGACSWNVSPYGVRDMLGIVEWCMPHDMDRFKQPATTGRRSFGSRHPQFIHGYQFPIKGARSLTGAPDGGSWRRQHSIQGSAVLGFRVVLLED